jgi:flavin-dependent dehydrogenase
MDDFDVVVVGGGPGGCAAAITCAQSGLKVALLEKSIFPRHHPGETLHPGVEPILKQLNVWDAVQHAGFLRHRGTEIEWFEPRRFEAFGADALGDWLGFQAWRADFDSILIERAKLAGVRVIHPCSALRPMVTNDRVTGVFTNRGEFTAKFTIDATGSVGWIENHLSLGKQCLTPKLIARFGYVSGKCPARDDNPLIVADPEGWTWTARIRPHLYQWTRLDLTEESIPKDWHPLEYDGMTQFGSVKSADVTWQLVQKTAGAGFFIVGDAAAVIDPAAARGVLKALMSGIMAAHLIGRSIESVISRSSQVTQIETHCIETYQQWLKDWFWHDVTNLKNLYAQFPQIFMDSILIH